MPTRRDLLTAVAIGGFGGALSPDRATAQGTANWPSPAEARRIAEAGYIFGLPIVMSYSVMYEYPVDRSSTQFKAPFNEINNEAHVYTYQDTTIITLNSDTPYSMCWLDRRAEPMVLSVPSVTRSRYHVVQLVDGST
jgi:hypothetical protein